MPDDLQPDEGQGDAGTGIFDPYLQAVPEDARDAVAGYLKDAEKNVNGRLAQAAELEKTWAPYSDVRDTLTAYDPEQLSQLLAWHQQVTASDDAFKTWLQQASTEAGLTPQQEQQLASAEEQGELTREEVQQLIQQTAERRVEPVEQQLTALQQEREVDHEARAIDQAFAQIQAANNGLELSKEQKAVILDLGMPLALDGKGRELPMGDASWVQAGFDRWREITAAGQRAFVEDKTRQPAAALTSGGTPALKPITSYEDAGKALRERLRQQP
jgi:ABC-type transporter Mla subunit MlaD